MSATRATASGMGNMFLPFASAEHGWRAVEVVADPVLADGVASAVVATGRVGGALLLVVLKHSETRRANSLGQSSTRRVISSNLEVTLKPW